jgi:hypothetical protein
MRDCLRQSRRFHVLSLRVFSPIGGDSYFCVARGPFFINLLKAYPARQSLEFSFGIAVNNCTCHALECSRRFFDETVYGIYVAFTMS